MDPVVFKLLSIFFKAIVEKDRGILFWSMVDEKIVVLGEKHKNELTLLYGKVITPAVELLQPQKLILVS